jgi:O-methyltransferase
MSSRKGIVGKFTKWLSAPWFRHSNMFNYFNKITSYTQREILVKNILSFVAVNKVEGDYLEFGVWEGESFTNAFHFAKKHKRLRDMRYYAFDSFEGLPTSEDVDLKMGSMEIHNWHKGKYSSGGVKKFLKNVKKAKMPLKKVTCVPGFYDQSLNKKTKQKLTLKKAAFIYVDCDLYESTVPVMNFITDYVTEGTVIMFDDWFNYRGNPNKGEQKAFYEWLKRNPHIEAMEFQKVGGKYNSFVLFPNKKK